MMFLLSAAVYNSYYLYKLIHLNSKLSHKSFQHEVAMKLVQNSAANERKRESTVQITGENDVFTQPKHHYIKLSKKKYCEACKMKKSRPQKKSLILTVRCMLRYRCCLMCCYLTLLKEAIHP